MQYNKRIIMCSKVLLSMLIFVAYTFSAVQVKDIIENTLRNKQALGYQGSVKVAS